MSLISLGSTEAGGLGFRGRFWAKEKKETIMRGFLHHKSTLSTFSPPPFSLGRSFSLTFCRVV